MNDTMKRIIGPNSAPAWFVGAVVATAVGIILSATSTQLPGAVPLTVEDAVDAAGAVALGGLGVVLVRRGVAAGLGRALILIVAVASSMWLCGGLADAITDGSSPPVTAQLLTLISTVLFVPFFVLLVLVPLLLFPTGQLPSPRWRWLVAAAVSGTVISMISMLLAPGLLDEDVPAWGENPLGVDVLDGLTSALGVVGLVLVLASVPASLAAVVVRVVQYSGPRRRQMWWFVAGVSPLLVGLVIDLDSSPTVSLITAIVIFTSLPAAMGWALLGSPGRRVALHVRQMEDRAQAQPSAPAQA